MKISAAQHTVLRRMKCGYKYQASWDKKSARECRFDIRTGNPDDINCPSISPLMNKGFVAFSNQKVSREKGLYYNVVLTELAHDFLKQNP